RLALPRGVRRAPRRRAASAARHAPRRRRRGEERRPPPAAGGRPRPPRRAPGRPRGGRARRRLPGRARHWRVGRDGRSPRVLAARAAVRPAPGRGGARGALRRLAAARERRAGAVLVTLAEQLGREVVAMRDGSLPPDVLARALDLLRDHLGVASGERVLRAAVAGYDVAARLAMALGPAAHYRRGFHLTATCGAFGAAAAAGAVLGLEAAAIAAALGIAGSQAAGSMEFLAGGSWTKRFQTGWAACAGLHAAALAQAGFSGPATILEGRFGFLHAYSDGATTAPLASRDRYELMQTSVKPHACCRYMQGPIDAVLALRAAHPIEPGEVERVEVGMLAAGMPIVCEPA